MFGLDQCVQAFLKGTPRFHHVCGQVRIQCCEGGVVLQLRVRGLPCGACQSCYRFGIEGGCGCPALELAGVPAWQGEAALTCYMGGFTPESLIRRCAYLAGRDGCGVRVADGVFRPCCGLWPEMDGCRAKQPACCEEACRPLMPRGRPLYPALLPGESPFC